MIRSMTAFARVNGSAGKSPWVIEIRSLNHRYFDCSIRLPPDYFDYEMDIRDLVKSQVARGKIAVNITKANEEEAGHLKLDETVVKGYLQAVRKIKKRYSVQGEISVRELIALPQLFAYSKVEEPPQKGWSRLAKLVKRAVGQMLKAKRREGQKIAHDLSKRLGLIEAAVGRIQTHTSKQAERYYQKLKGRLEEILDTTKVDQEKIWREVAFLAERSDITEEIVRMKSHLSLFRQHLQVDREIGREMDFLCQELHREMNTMGAKSQFFDISRDVVFVKGELEKIREQVQNIE